MGEIKEKIKSKDVSKITEKIYLGGIEGAKEVEYLKQEGITNILTLIGDESPEYEKGLFDREKINADDISIEDLFKYFRFSIDFIEDSNKIYIHCLAGMSRSATIVIAYLMWKKHIKYEDAFNFVKEKRKCIEPNEGFIIQLKYFDELLNKNNYDLRKINFIKGLNLRELYQQYNFNFNCT